MTAVLERLEYMVWRLAAEPTQAKMDRLLGYVVRHAGEIAESGELAPVPVSVPASARDQDPATPAFSYPSQLIELPDAPALPGHRFMPDILPDSEEDTAGGVDIETVIGFAAEAVTAGGDGDTQEAGAADAKSCSKCKKQKPLGEFSKDRSAPGGLRYTCKACDSATRAARRAAMRLPVMSREGAA